jgi:hypothetical protein
VLRPPFPSFRPGPCGCRRSGQCILPPRVLRTVAERGNEHQRRVALRTLALDETMRSARLETGARLAAGALQRVSAVAPLREPAKTRLVRDAAGARTCSRPSPGGRAIRRSVTWRWTRPTSTSA